MGYDITFHPIRPSEIKHFVFDVVDNPDLASRRIDELLKIAKHSDSVETVEEGDRDLLQSVYQNLLEMTSPQKTEPTPHHEVAYLCAAIASFLHPYWYTRGLFLSHFIQESVLQGGIFTSLQTYGSTGVQYKIEDGDLMIGCNYTASGYVDATIACTISSSTFSQLQATRELLVRAQQEFDVLSRHFTKKITKRIKGFLGKTPDAFPHATILSDIDYLVDNEFDAENNELGWALRSLEVYCKEHKTGFIEAADIVIPPTGEVFGHFDNFRATFLGHHLQST